MLPDNLYELLRKYNRKISQIIDAQDNAKDRSLINYLVFDGFLETSVTFDRESGVKETAHLTKRGRRRLFIEGTYRIFRDSIRYLFHNH